MTMRPLCLRQLTFTGPNKAPAVLEFGNGLNVIYGASDTGKSFVLESIDFMLGGQGPLRDIPERIGYDRIALAVEDSDRNTFTLFRAASGGHFQVVDGVHQTLPAQVEARVLLGKHSATNTENISTFLLERIGLSNKRVRINKRNETNNLGFRNLCHLALVDEGQIQKQSSPIESGQFTQRTREIAVFKLLLTGVDDSAVVAPAREANGNQSASAKLEIINELIEQYRSLIGEEDPTEEELNEQLEKLDASIEREQESLQSTQGNYNQLIEQRTGLRSRVRSSAERRAEIDELLARFALLDTHYQSDLRRLDGIIEAGNLIDALVPGSCPLCGAAPEHRNPTAECDGNVALAVTAATAESEKIQQLRRELADTVRQLGQEAASFDRIAPRMQEQLNQLDEQIRLMLPNVAERRTSYSEFVEERSKVRNALARFAQISDLEQRRDALEQASPVEGQDANASVTELPSTTLDKFSREVESILKEWHFPEADRVYFEQANRDLVIAGKQRGSRGKGMRAITHAAFTIGLMEFCRKEGHAHPGFVVLDSPLLAYREPESTDDDLRGTDVQDHFYEFLARLTSEQAIIIENVDPPRAIRERDQSILFTRNYQVGRFGFFPPIPQPGAVG
jgi:hypothetical protein